MEINSGKELVGEVRRE